MPRGQWPLVRWTTVLPKSTKKQVASTTTTSSEQVRPLLSGRTWNNTHSFEGRVIDDQATAASVYQFLCSHPNHVVIHGGDYHNARLLLTAVRKRATRRPEQYRVDKQSSVLEQWQLQRANLYHQVSITYRYLLGVTSQHQLDCRRAPQRFGSILKRAFDDALCTTDSQQQPYVTPLQEVLSRVGVDQWRQKGVFVEALQDYVYPDFGVFPPTRQEHIHLLQQQCINDKATVHNNNNNNHPTSFMDVGTGTGVLAALVLQHYPNSRVICTDHNPVALQCARSNLERLFPSKDTTGCKKIEYYHGNLFAPTTVDVIVCNPPWLPGTAHSLLESSIYDTHQGFLTTFLRDARSHLTNDAGEVWLLLSNLAVLLGLRSRDEFLQRIDDGGLYIQEERSTTTPSIGAKDVDYPLVAQARQNEVVTLYKLACK